MHGNSFVLYLPNYCSPRQRLADLILFLDQLNLFQDSYHLVPSTIYNVPILCLP